ncbi:MAG: phage protein Gp36 family protein [Cyanobacteria bacterium P01_E01_bin.42]
MLNFPQTHYQFDPLVHRVALPYKWVWAVVVRMAGDLELGRDYEADLAAGLVTRLDAEGLRDRISPESTALFSYSHAGGTVENEPHAFANGIVQLPHVDIANLVVSPVEPLEYERDRDYSLNSQMGVLTRLEEGAIAQEEIVSIEYSAFGVLDSEDNPTDAGLYCTPDELEAAIGKEELITLSNTGNSGKAIEPDYRKIAIHVENVSSDIDSRVIQAYAIPLNPILATIRGKAIDMVRLRLDISQGEEADKMYERAISALKEIAENQLLPVGRDEEESPIATGVSGGTATPAFTRENLKNWI